MRAAADNARQIVEEAQKRTDAKSQRYEGLLHTDHAVRAEFFDGRDDAVTEAAPYLMDFTYLYDTRLEDFVNFSGGKPVSEDALFDEIGRPETWTHRTATQEADRAASESAEIAELMAKIYDWEPVPTYLERDPLR